MAENNREDLFDQWAQAYDADVQTTNARAAFPFAGYDDVITTAVQYTDPRAGLSVLDVGIGTGKLARQLLAQGCDVWGLDFSAKMLEEAQAFLSVERLIQADLRQPLPDTLPTHLDRIVATYVLHEFNGATKVDLITRLVDRLAPDGYLVVGDIAFATTEMFNAAHEKWKQRWDEDEFYWNIESATAVLGRSGLALEEYKQVSMCAGVLKICKK